MPNLLNWLKRRKIGLNQVEPRGIRGSPIYMDAPTDSRWEFPKRLFVGAEVIHNQTDPALGPGWQHVIQPETSATISRSCGKSFADGKATMRVEGTKPLQRSIALVTVRTQSGLPAPCTSAPGNCLQRSHFIKADNLAPSRPMAVDLNYSIFFTSNSGSLLSHQV